jgi:hypothetical protein
VTTDLGNDTEFKVRYIQAATMQVNPEDPSTAEFIPMVLTPLSEAIQEQLSSGTLSRPTQNAMVMLQRCVKGMLFN